MDDFELEARLRTHLHRRFDDAPLPSGLATNVSQALGTAARPIGLASPTGRIRLGWAAVAAAIVIVTVIGVGKGLVVSGPAAVPSATPSAVPGALDRTFIVLPVNGTLVGKAESTLADSVLSARLRALGIGNFTSSGNEVLTFSVPVGGPSDASIRAVLAATGDVRIVPLPAADYGIGMRVATVGVSLPKDEPALIGWDGIASIAGISSSGAQSLAITLKPAAAQAFDDYRASNAGESFAIVVDERVALLAPVDEQATSGQLTLLPPSDNSFAETAAILIGGELPEAWRGASVPVLITQDQAVGPALAAVHGGTVQRAELGVDLSGDTWQVVWNIEVAQPGCAGYASCVSPGWSKLVKVDAVTGTVEHIGVLEP